MASSLWVHRCFSNIPSVSSRWRTVAQRVFSVQMDRIRSGGFPDANGTSDLADRLQAHWIVVDGYMFDRRFVKTLSEKNKKILFIDDLGGISRRLGNVVLNPNPLARPPFMGWFIKKKSIHIGSSLRVVAPRVLGVPAKKKVKSKRLSSSCDHGRKRSVK